MMDKLLQCKQCRLSDTNNTDQTGKPFCKNWGTYMDSGCFYGIPKIHSVYDGLKITEVWPVSTEVLPNGGIGVSWSSKGGFGQLTLYWDNGKLVADTETLSEKFLKRILELLPDFIPIT